MGPRRRRGDAAAGLSIHQVAANYDNDNYLTLRRQAAAKQPLDKCLENHD